jgi:hypothetical protein
MSSKNPLNPPEGDFWSRIFWCDFGFVRWMLLFFAGKSGRRLPDLPANFFLNAMNW